MDTPWQRLPFSGVRIWVRYYKGHDWAIQEVGDGSIIGRGNSIILAAKAELDGQRRSSVG
jgi:hypothetical protein